MKKVLLLGDSIRMSYQQLVAGKLAGAVEVVGPQDNCQYSLYTLSSLNRWIGELGKPDIVHWNSGRSPVQIPIDMYRTYLAFILDQLTALTPRVVWATTTPVQPDRPFRDTQWAWRNEEIDQYNGAAKELMASRGIPINDLHVLVWNNVDNFLSEDQLHLSDTGQEACAKAVAESVLRLLKPQ